LVAVSACGLAPREPRWKVDVVNGDQLLQISITTDRAGWAWMVRPGARMVLLDEPDAPREGVIQLIDPHSCNLFDTADLLPESFTILADSVGAGALDFELRLVEGASLVGPKNVNFEAACSG
jgi:hypothetical protein